MLRTLMVIVSVLLLSTGAWGGNATYKYDERDRLKEVLYSDGHGIRYVYDKIGNLLEKQMLAPDALFYNIETSVVGGGWIAPAGNGIIRYGNSQTYTITPFWDWYLQDI